MTKIPLCSSDKIIHVLHQNGFYPGRWKGGSHQPLVKDLPGGRKKTVTVVVGKKEIPRPTLRDWLKRAQKSEEHFLKLLKS